MADSVLGDKKMLQQLKRYRFLKADRAPHRIPRAMMLIEDLEKAVKDGVYNLIAQ